MRSRDTLVRLQQFKVEDKKRDVHDLEIMIADFEKKETDLLQMITHEEERAGISDPDHFSYPTTAKASRDRRDNLLRSISELRIQLELAKSSLAEEESEMRKLELLAEKDMGVKGSGKSDTEQVIAESILTAH